MPETSDRWSLIKAVPNGHKFFKDNVTELIAIADNSGYYPDETEDGTLFLDTDQPITQQETPPYSYNLPLLKLDGESCSTPISPAEANWVCYEFNMPIVRPKLSE